MLMLVGLARFRQFEPDEKPYYAGLFDSILPKKEISSSCRFDLPRLTLSRLDIPFGSFPRRIFPETYAVSMSLSARYFTRRIPCRALKRSAGSIAGQWGSWIHVLYADRAGWRKGGGFSLRHNDRARRSISRPLRASRVSAGWGRNNSL